MFFFVFLKAFISYAQNKSVKTCMDIKNLKYLMEEEIPSGTKWGVKYTVKPFIASWKNSEKL